jgi:hypothetical protein
MCNGCRRGAAPISIANGPVPSLQYANPSMGRYQALYTAVNGKSGAGQPIRHPASHLPGTGGRQPLHIAVNGKSGVGQPIRHPASLLPGTGFRLLLYIMLDIFPSKDLHTVMMERVHWLSK